MVEHSIDRLVFSHLTFQEFFVVDYFRVRPGHDIATVNMVEQRWREPVLLMCGLDRTPTGLIAKMCAADPILGLYGIAEVDPAYLDISMAGDVVDNVVQSVDRGELPLAEAIPAIVGLMSIEGNPVGEKVRDFIYSSIRGDPRESLGEIIEALSKSQTRGTAAALLSLLLREDLNNSSDIIIAGLARNGDPSVYGVSDAAARGEIEDGRVFQFLVSCESRAAVEMLWTRYRLTPPESREVEWAKAWARRLRDSETDDSLRELGDSGIIVNDYMSWPYRADDQSIVSALVCRALDVLKGHYRTMLEIAPDAEVIARCSLRVQVPLLATRADLPAGAAEDWKVFLTAHGIQAPDDSGRTRQAAAEYLASAFGVTESWRPIDLAQFNVFSSFSGVSPVSRFGFWGRFSSIFDAHAWRTLGGFLDQKRSGSRSLARKAGAASGVATEVVVIVLSTLGIRALLPPDGTYVGLWGLAPVWLRICALIAFVALCAFAAYKMNVDTLDSDLILLFGVCMTVLSSLLIVPLFWLILFCVIPAPRLVEESISTRRMMWGWAVSGSGVALVCGVLSAAAIRRWGAEIPIVATSAVIAGVTLGAMCVQVRSLAFQHNELARWLESHQRGREVLDEFKR